MAPRLRAQKEDQRMEVFLNPNALGTVPSARANDAPIALHRKLPGYERTPLVECAGLAAELGLGGLWVKDESSRLGLPAFKMLGASYAVYRAVVERLGAEPTWDTVEELRGICASLQPMALAAATDGNHGRAVARMAALLGFRANIYVPTGTVPARIEAIESEGASVAVVDGDYDAAVARSAQDASEHCIVVSDTSWPGYETIPAWVVEGYSTIFSEIRDELEGRRSPVPDVVVVPMGVGALAAATIGDFKAEGSDPNPIIVGVEPLTADCVLESLRAAAMVSVPGPHESIMAGLNCGTPSPVAWPLVSRGVDVAVAIDDDWAREAMRGLAKVGVTADATGAAALGGLMALLSTDSTAALRRSCGLDADASVLIICTEGATDPDAYRVIVGDALASS